LNNIKGRIKISITDNGGEYGYGIIEEKEKINFIKELMDQEELCIENEDEEKGIEAKFYECDKQLFHVYGPAISDETTIRIVGCDNEYCEEENEEFLEEKLEDTPVNIFVYDNPYYDEEELNKFDKNALQFGGYYIEKNIEFPAVMEIKKEDNFDLSCIYIGTTNMDETLNDDEVVNIILYIPQEKAKKILELYDIDIPVDELNEYLSEIYDEIRKENNENNNKIKKILDECTCEVLDIEGRGWAQYNHVMVKDMDDEILYENDCE